MEKRLLSEVIYNIISCAPSSLPLGWVNTSPSSTIALARDPFSHLAGPQLSAAWMFICIFEAFKVGSWVFSWKRWVMPIEPLFLKTTRNCVLACSTKNRFDGCYFVLTTLNRTNNRAVMNREVMVPPIQTRQRLIRLLCTLIFLPYAIYWLSSGE